MAVEVEGELRKVKFHLSFSLSLSLFTLCSHTHKSDEEERGRWRAVSKGGLANLEQPTVERRREKDGDIFLVLWRRKGVTSRKDKKNHHI